MTEDAKEKDREAVRTIPLKLARAGFRVVRMSSGEWPAPEPAALKLGAG